MELLVLSTILIAVGICFVPVYLLGGRTFLRRQDFAVSSQATPPEVIRNSSTAYALRLMIFGLFFAWGASGDFWPALISAACYSMGWGLIFLLRRPIIEFMNGALRNDQSITVHEFITRQHGNDRRVRLFSSGLTIFTLFAVVVAEAIAVSAFLQPLHLAGTSSVDLAIVGVLLAMALYATLSGNSAVMQFGTVAVWPNLPGPVRNSRAVALYSCFRTDAAAASRRVCNPHFRMLLRLHPLLPPLKICRHQSCPARRRSGQWKFKRLLDRQIAQEVWQGSQSRHFGVRVFDHRPCWHGISFCGTSRNWAQRRRGFADRNTCNKCGFDRTDHLAAVLSNR